MDEFCRNGGFHVWSDGDFTECFEDFGLFGILNFMFFIAGSFRLIQLSHYPLIEVPRSRIHVTKMVLSALMSVIPLLILLDQLMEGRNQPYQIVWSATMTLTWMFNIAILNREYRRALPHNWVLRVFWILTFCCGCFKLRTVIRGSHLHPPTVTSFDFSTYLVQYILMALMTVMAVFFHKSHEAFDRYAVLPQLNENQGRGYGLNIEPLLNVLRPEVALLALGVVCSIVSAILFMIQPYLIGRIIDDVTEHREADSRNRLNTFAAVLISIYACDAVFHGSHMVLFIVSSERMAARVRSSVFKAYLQQEMAFFDDHGTGELMQLLEEDVSNVQHLVSDRLSNSLTQAVNIAAGFCFVFILSWKLTLVMLAMAPVAALCQIASGKIVRGLTKRQMEAANTSLQVAEETLMSIRTVRAFSKDEREANRFANSTSIAFRLARRMGIARGVCESAAMFAMNGCIVMGLWYGGLLVLRGPTELTGGQLTSYILYTLYIVFSVTQLTGLINHVLRTAASSAKLLAVLRRRPKMDHRGGLTTHHMIGNLNFVDVHFQFASRVDAPCLAGVSFSVEAGSCVALVGPAMGGKTTIAALLERFYDPQQGKILLDSKDLSSYDPRWLRDQIGIVTQEPVMFANSVAKNISYSKEEATLAEVVEVARQAKAHEFICSLPDGYQTIIGESGVRISADQRQRIAIARALLKNPKIVIVAEGSVDMDSEHQHMVDEAMAGLIRDKTSIVIANRLSTMRSAAKIVVVNGGQVTQQGPHSVLISQPGYYKQLVSRALEGISLQEAEETNEVENVSLLEQKATDLSASNDNLVVQDRLNAANELACRLEERLKAGDHDVLELVSQLKRQLSSSSSSSSQSS